MVDTRRSSAAKRPAAQQEEEEEGEKSSSPAPVPTDQSAEAGDGVAAAAQPAKRAKVRISPPVCAWQDRSRAAVRRFDLIFFSVVALRRVVVVVGREHGD
jgi:hypothetical protein